LELAVGSFGRPIRRVARSCAAAVHPCSCSAPLRCKTAQRLKLVQLLMLSGVATAQQGAQRAKRELDHPHPYFGVSRSRSKRKTGVSKLGEAERSLRFG
jgi:hypothetical protein